MNKDPFDTARYDFDLPAELIAQKPKSRRDKARLLVISRKTSSFQDTTFSRVTEFLKPGDLLILNNTKVIKARLFGVRPSNGKAEIFLLKPIDDLHWEALLKPGKRIKDGETLSFKDTPVTATVLRKEQSSWIIRFSQKNLDGFLAVAGNVPLPPYIKRQVDDENQYQTVYAKNQGAVAAPTAGFHFTPALLKQIEKAGIETAFITLHCGLGTFRPVSSNDIREHRMHKEWLEITEATAEKIRQAKRQNRRIIAVGTTSIRTLESAAARAKKPDDYLQAFSGETDFYIYPGYRFKIIDAVITNFHTPRSTNLILISTFGGYPLVKRAYRYAIEEQFRFFSFGDSMMIL